MELASSSKSLLARDLETPQKRVIEVMIMLWTYAP